MKTPTKMLTDKSSNVALWVLLRPVWPGHHPAFSGGCTGSKVVKTRMIPVCSPGFWPMA